RSRSPATLRASTMRACVLPSAVNITQRSDADVPRATSTRIHAFVFTARHLHPDPRLRVHHREPHLGSLVSLPATRLFDEEAAVEKLHAHGALRQPEEPPPSRPAPPLWLHWYGYEHRRSREIIDVCMALPGRSGS